MKSARNASVALLTSLLVSENALLVTDGFHECESLMRDSREADLRNASWPEIAIQPSRDLPQTP